MQITTLFYTHLFRLTRVSVKWSSVKHSLTVANVFCVVLLISAVFTFTCQNDQGFTNSFKIKFSIMYDVRASLGFSNANLCVWYTKTKLTLWWTLTKPHSERERERERAVNVMRGFITGRCAEEGVECWRGWGRIQPLSNGNCSRGPRRYEHAESLSHSANVKDKQVSCLAEETFTCTEPPSVISSRVCYYPFWKY